MTRATGWVLAFAAWIAIGCGGSRAPVEDPNEPPYKKILRGLLVTDVDNPPTPTVVDGSGSEHVIDPATWQPLDRPVQRLGPGAGLLQVGATVQASNGGAIRAGYWKDAQGGYAQYNALDAQADAPLDGFAGVRAIAAADVDGDGVDEGVLLYVKSPADPAVYFRVFQGAGAAWPEAVVPGLTHDALSTGRSLGTHTALGTPWFPYWSAIRANLDGPAADGQTREKVVLADYDTLYVLGLARDDQGAWHVTFDPSTDVKTLTAVSGLAAADADGDGRDELAVGLVNGWALYHHDGGFQALTSPEVSPVAEANGPVEVTFGDFNGSQRPQLVLAARLASDGGKASAWMYQLDAAAQRDVAGRKVATVTTNWLGQNNAGSDDWFRLLPRAADLDGLVQGQKKHDGLLLLGCFFKSPWTSAVPDDTMDRWFPAALAAENTLVDVQVGDMLRDPFGQQVFMVLSAGPNGAHLNAFRMDSGNTNIERLLKLTDHFTEHYPYWPNDAFASGVGMALGSYEDDVPLVSYVGHELTFSEPVIIAALASPPYWADVAAAEPAYQAAYPNWVTTFGQTSATDTTTSHGVGYEVGVQIDFAHQFELPVLGVKVGELRATAAFQRATNKQWDSTVGYARSVQYNCTAGQDEVVFSAVAIDRYQYEVLRLPGNADPPKYMYINIPREPRIHKVTRAFFNAKVGGWLPTVDQAVFPHTLGNPRSYPTRNDKDALMVASFAAGTPYDAYQSSLHPVPQGDDGKPDPGTIQATIELSRGTGYSVTHDYSVDTSVGAGVGDWTVSLTAGFNTSYGSQSTSSTTTVMGGTIGYLPTRFLDLAHGYAAGVFTYPHSTPYGRQYWVVNYWVE